MQNIIAGGIVLLIFALSLYYSLRGKGSSCSSCSSSGSCHSKSCSTSSYNPPSKNEKNNKNSDLKGIMDPMK